MFELQLVVVVFALGMLYWTYFSFRRSVLRLPETVLWALAWSGAIAIALRPASSAAFIQNLRISRAMDLFVIVGFLLVWVVLFFNHLENRRLKRQLAELVRQLALRESKERRPPPP